MTLPLFDFAFINNIEAKIDELSKLAQSENWEYRHTEFDHPMPILYNYLHYTFSRIQEEGKIAYSTNNQKACFNTGLVTENYEEIFGLFVPHTNPRPDGPKWYFQKFCKESDRSLLDIGQLPVMAHYFDDPAELLYDTRLEIRKNVDHIIDDNRDRFPESFKSMPDNYQLRLALEGAIDHSVKRVERNYKTAVPQFYQGRLQLLLPLCMSNRARADLALVVYRENRVYLASTVLTIDMAYNNARLIARPDTEWLEP